jgi:hypothetical protein
MANFPVCPGVAGELEGGGVTVRIGKHVRGALAAAAVGALVATGSVVVAAPAG